MITRIVSGGQTGADRAALDWAIAHGVAHGGWCPAGRLAEDGPIADRYRLQETQSAGYWQRTRRNVEDSDATLIVNLGVLDGGTLQTLELATRLGKPVHLAQIDDGSDAAAPFGRWLAGLAIATLNVAGPRESKRPGTYRATWALLDALDIAVFARRPDRVSILASSAIAGRGGAMSGISGGRLLAALAAILPLAGLHAGEPGPAVTILIPPRPVDPPAAAPPVVTLPGTDWAAAGKAEGVAANADLAGDPSAASVRTRPDPAVQDSYFNSKDWQQYQSFAAHGRVGTGRQFAAAGKEAALQIGNLAVGQAIEDALK